VIIKSFQLRNADRSGFAAIEIYSKVYDAYSLVATVIKSPIQGCMISHERRLIQHPEEERRFIEGMELAIVITENFQNYYEGKIWRLTNRNSANYP